MFPGRLKTTNSVELVLSSQDTTTSLGTQFPHFHLEDKVAFIGRGNVRTDICVTQRRRGSAAQMTHKGDGGPLKIAKTHGRIVSRQLENKQQ